MDIIGQQMYYLHYTAVSLGQVVGYRLERGIGTFDWLQNLGRRGHSAKLKHNERCNKFEAIEFCVIADSEFHAANLRTL